MGLPRFSKFCHKTKIFPTAILLSKRCFFSKWGLGHPCSSGPHASFLSFLRLRHSLCCLPPFSSDHLGLIIKTCQTSFSSTKPSWAPAHFSTRHPMWAMVCLCAPILHACNGLNIIHRSSAIHWPSEVSEVRAIFFISVFLAATTWTKWTSSET
jgi:hypothetical protein